MHAYKVVNPPRGGYPLARVNPPENAGEPHEGLTCPQCSGTGHLLGELGGTAWFRCRDCGWEFARRRNPWPWSRPQTEIVPARSRELQLRDWYLAQGIDTGQVDGPAGWAGVEAAYRAAGSPRLENPWPWSRAQTEIVPARSRELQLRDWYLAQGIDTGQVDGPAGWAGVEAAYRAAGSPRLENPFFAPPAIQYVSMVPRPGMHLTNPPTSLYGADRPFHPGSGPFHGMRNPAEPCSCGSGLPANKIYKTPGGVTAEGRTAMKTVVACDACWVHRLRPTLESQPWARHLKPGSEQNPKSKKCVAGYHDYDPVTFVCRRRGCGTRRDEPGQLYAFGQEAQPPSFVQGTMFGYDATAERQAHLEAERLRLQQSRPEEPGQGGLFNPYGRCRNCGSALAMGLSSCPVCTAPTPVSNPGRTLEDAAEAWARGRGIKVPQRGSAAWRGLYEVWVRTGMKVNPRVKGRGKTPKAPSKPKRTRARRRRPV